MRGAFIVLSDEDSIKVCLLLSLEVIFMGHELGYAVDDVFLRMVDNLKAWNVFSWGEHIWRELYTAIRIVNSKHNDIHHKALEINLNFVSSYSLSGFVLCFKVITPKTKATNVKHKVNTAGTKRRLRLQLMLEEKNSMKSIDRSNSTLMKLALETCETTKRRYVNVLRTPMEVDTEIKGPSLDTLKNQKNVLDAYMIERCQDLKPWEKDLNRPFKCIDKIYCDYYLEQFLSSSGWRHCKFPWCNDFVVDRPFWDILIGLDDNRLGWLHEEIRRCLESKLHVVRQETGVFVSKGIDPIHYSIKFRHAQNVPK
nr:phospholipase-like, aminotransferase-like mobile domain protein [Tanacetum cinerariifolium]